MQHPTERKHYSHLTIISLASQRFPVQKVDNGITLCLLGDTVPQCKIPCILSSVTFKHISNNNILQKLFDSVLNRSSLFQNKDE